MPHIQQLSSHVADLIAAGEVVERPASVVKELMENAIDAGADALTVEIQHGGMSLIRVTDNGCGIAAAEAETAFLRHATSKLRTEYDLEAIGTLGFRGEALAAISAVSRIELLTRTAEEDLGAALSLEGGAVVHREEAGCPQGTTMVVRDLFYNTPARLKFLKKDAAEGAACFAMVQRVALSHPEVSVKFLRDGKQELLTPGNGQVQSALYAVLGRDMALGFTPVKGSGEDMSVSGFVSLPTCCRGTRGYQHFFVNGRYVKSRTMTAALEEAYAAEQKAEAARAQREKATQEADVIVKTEIDKRRRELEAEAEAEQIRRRAKGEADAILAKMQAEAQGAQEILVKQADGLRQIVAAAGGDADHAVRLMLADKMEELMRIQVDAVKGIKIDKVTVWDGGEQKDGKTATAGFVSGLMKSIPPMNEMFDMAGMELPRFLGKNKEEPAAPPAPAAEPGAPAEES